GRTPGQVKAQWRRAILRVLDYDEIAEFRLMDSAAAHRVQEWTRNLILSADERRTLVEWQRDFDAVHGSALAWAGAMPRERRWHEEAQWELHDRIRQLLGDARCVDYLGGASPAFNGMHDALEDLPGMTPTVLLDLWRLRREHLFMRSQESSLEKRMVLAAGMRAKLSTLLGEETYGRYAKDEEAAWLFPRPPAPRQKPTRP
ncbi:MAG: hypothetical protein JWQ83_1550, partial [Lacunisphaera sp.]|nr:hypothetical protein [Lacunisphaera sp.]